MIFKRNPLSQAIAAAIATTAAAPSFAAPAIEEIVVTATKRAESAQDIPVAVQAMSGDAISELGVDNFGEYVQYLPNVVYSGRGPGQAELYIRGAATEQSSITVSSVQGSAPAVALYQDEQPVSFGGRNLDIYAADLERIEVLAGPQGTLFGASSQTGTVRLITNKPQHDGVAAGFETKFSSTRGGDPSTSIEAFLNLPLSDRLAIRLTGFGDSAGGWIDNEQGTYTGNIEVMNRNQISSAAHICTGDPAIDDPIGGNCGGVRATMAVADNSTLAEDDFNTAVYSGARFGLSYLINDDWDLLVQHTQQSLATEGVFEYDPVLGSEDAVNRFARSENNDDFGLTTWTLNGRIANLELVYTGGYLDRDVFYVQDYTGYTNGGGYQAYYICTGGYSNYSECFDPTKQYLGETTNERITHELRFNTDPARRWRVTAGVFFDQQETISDGQFQYQGAVEAGFNTASAPGTITNPANAAPTPGNLVSTVDGVTNPFGRGPSTTFVNNFTREEEQIAFFGQFSFDITDEIEFSIGARSYDIDYEFTGSTGSSFGCKGAATPCDGQAFDNRVSDRLEALGAYAGSRDIADLESFFGAGTAATIANSIDSGQFFIDGLDSSGVINQDDTIYKATLSWNLSDDVMMFGSYSEGFRPQTANRNAGQPSSNQSGVYEGYLVPAIAKTDELENMEIGIKSQFFDDTLRFNATFYDSEISDLQVSRFDPANVAFLVFIENAGDAEITGVDLDFTWLVGDHWTFSGGASFVDNELTRVNPQLQEIVVPEGSRLPWTPEFRANLRARYDFFVDSIGAEAYVRGGLIYTGDSRAQTTCDAYQVEDVTRQVYGNGSGLKIANEGGFCGTPLTGGDLTSVTSPDFIGVDSNGDTRFKAGRYEQEAYTLVNLAAGMSRDGWRAEVFVDNVFDKNAQLNVNATDYTPSVTTNRPRTFGVRFGYTIE
ncbi:MAG: TonB-dependent receptor [Pseudomonadaceae bacterium]|nr:TonB-dependent receptor [Pseudomonadaceae bacterium]